MPTLVEDYSTVVRSQERAVVELRAPDVRPRSDAPGLVTETGVQVDLVAGHLEVEVEPGALLYRVLIRGQSRDWLQVTVPDVDGDVRLGSLLPEVPVTPTSPYVLRSDYEALLARVIALETGGVVTPPTPEPVAGFAPTFTPGF